MEKLGSRKAIENSIRLAGAQAIVDSLPRGLRTKLGSSGSESVPYGPSAENLGDMSATPYQGLSGGEVRLNTTRSSAST